MQWRKIPKRETFSFRLTASAYSFPWEFDGNEFKLVINGEPVKIKEVKNEIEYRGKVDEKSIKDVLGIDENLDEFYKIAVFDPILRRSIELLRGLHMRKVSLFDALITAVAQQNASFRQGWKMLGKLILKVGKRKGDHLLFPGPEEIYRAKNDMLKECGFGYRIKVLKEISTFFLDSGAKELEKVGNREAVQYLTSIKGVGEYTASWAVLFSRRAYEIFPFDRWFEKLLKEAYNTPKPQEETKRKWKDYIGLFAFYTTVATDALPISKTLENLKGGKIIPNLDSPKPTPLTLWRFKELFD